MLLAFLFVGTVTFAQEDVFKKEVLQQLKNSSVNKQFNDIYTETLQRVKNQFATKNVPSSVWEELEAKRSEQIENINTLLVDVYKKHYSLSELKTLKALNKEAKAHINETSEAWVATLHDVFSKYLTAKGFTRKVQ
jgi:hypothetical protein